MPDYPSTARWLFNQASGAIEKAIDVHSGRQLNQFEVSASAARFDFFNALSQDQNTEGYLTRLQDELFTTYDQMASDLQNPFVKEKITAFLNKKKEADRQAAIELSQRNAQVFGGQELISGLDDLLSRGKAADETYLGDENTPSYQQRVEFAIQGKVARAFASGIIGQDKAAELVREYTQRFRIGFTRDMSYEVLNTMLDSGMVTSDSLDLIEKIIRSEGGALEDVVNMADLEMSPEAMGRLGVLAQAKATVPLTPKMQEALVVDLRREANAITKRRETQEKEEIEFNDLKVHQMWGTEEGRRSLMANGYEALYGIFDAGTPEGRKEIAKWMRDLGEWDMKATQDRAREDAKRGWDIEIQRILDEKDLSAIGDTISEILNDKNILDAERDSMVSNLNAMKKAMESEGVVAGEEGEEFNPEPVRAEYDAKILDLTMAVMDNESGVVTKIKNLIQEIEDHEYFKTNEQDRNERTNKLLGLLSDLGKKGVKAVSTKSDISDMLSDPAYSEQDIRDAIRKAELEDSISGDEANTLYNRLDTRAEVHLGDVNAGRAIKTVNSYFYGRVNARDIKDDEAALLAQEMMTADNALRSLIDSDVYRMEENPIRQKEMIDTIMIDILSPVITRTLAQEALGFFGLSKEPDRPSLYSQFKTVGSDQFRERLQMEVVEEWRALLAEEKWVNFDLSNVVSKRTLEGDEYIIEFLHTPSGTYLTRRGDKWYAKWSADGEYQEVENRLIGEDTKKMLEEIRG